MLVFLVIIGVSFAVMASRLTGFVEEYLYQQRIRQNSLSLERLATTVAPLFQSAASDAVNETISQSAGEMGGRLIVVDQDGKIQFDSFSTLLGTRLQLREVTDVIAGSENSSWGVHTLQAGEEVADLIPSDSGSYISCCAARLIGTRGSLGALVYLFPISDLMDSLSAVERQLLVIFGIVAVAAMAAALVFSHILTRPIQSLSTAIQKMGGGDLSQRAPVQGSYEFRRLAENYNRMAEQLENLDQSRNQFVSNASHELKTPMTTMKILLENMLYDPNMPSDIRMEFLQDMNHEIDRLTHIVSDLLTLTKTDHKMEMHLEDMDLSECMQETVHSLQPMAESRNQTLQMKVSPGVRITADPNKVPQIIYNLVENALKYSNDGGRVQVGLSVRDKNAVITVRDNGVGISKDDQAHVFERFYRVDKARSRETGGTGLGLSIVSQFVKLHHGEITLESTPGKGSIFRVLLPLKQEGSAS